MIISRVSSWRLLVGDSITPGLGTGVPGSVRFDDPGAVAALRRAGTHDQAAALAGRPPSAGLFKVFLGQQGRADQFRFGREADGSPSAPWGWEDLDLWLAPPSVVEQREPSAAPTRVSVRRPSAEHTDVPPSGRAACGNAVLYDQSAQ